MSLGHLDETKCIKDLTLYFRDQDSMVFTGDMIDAVRISGVTPLESQADAGKDALTAKHISVKFNAQGDGSHWPFGIPEVFGYPEETRFDRVTSWDDVSAIELQLADGNGLRYETKASDQVVRTLTGGCTEGQTSSVRDFCLYLLIDSDKTIDEAFPPGQTHNWFEIEKAEARTEGYDFLAGLNPQQYEAATHLDGPLLILAGAGSGKTRVLVHRVAYMIDRGVDPKSILLLTFTNQAAKEMRERAENLLDPRCGEITASTFHSFCASMLRKYAAYTDYGNDFSILSSPEVQDGIGLVKSQEGDLFKKKRGFPSNKVVANMISSSVNKEMPLEEVCDAEYAKYKPYISDIMAIANMYSTYKIEHNMMDYDDLLVRFLRLLEQNEGVRKAIASTYQYVMVDEYQDTNHLQEKILFLLCRDTWNLVVVGDDAQSIYAFRGADIENILGFPTKVPGCKIVALEQNYRSTQEVLDFANCVMDNHSTMGFRKHMVSGRGLHGYEKPHILFPGNPREEAEEARDIIARWIRQGVPRQEIAVMARSSSSLYQLETLITAMNLPYKKLGGLKFLEHICVQDVLAYLRCVTNPLDQLAWFRILQLLPGIGDVYASRLAELAPYQEDFLTNNKYRKTKFYPELQALDEEINALRKAFTFEEEMEEAVRHYLALRQRLIDEGRFKDEAARTEQGTILERDKETLALLKEIALEYNSVTAFLDAVTLDATGRDPSKQDNPLTLTTIHSAKGLEFNSVIILDCNDEVFPKNGAEEAGSFEEQEELRCFYVAITRAKKNLVLFCPRRGQVCGQWTDLELSHFLKEADGCTEGLERRPMRRRRWDYEADDWGASWSLAPH